MVAFDFRRENLTTALVTVPDGTASAILAGVKPVHGLYALLVGTPIAALDLSSRFMYVANQVTALLVLTAFMSGIAELILLGQLGEFTSFHSTETHKIAQAAYLIAHLGHIQWQPLAVGLVAVSMIPLIERAPLMLAKGA